MITLTIRGAEYFVERKLKFLTKTLGKKKLDSMQINGEKIGSYFGIKLEKNRLNEYILYGNNDFPVSFQLYEDRIEASFYHNSAAPLEDTLASYQKVKEFIESQFQGMKLYFRFGGDCKITVERGKVVSVIYEHHELYKGVMDNIPGVETLTFHH